MKPEQKNYPQEVVDIYQKHIGINAEHQYIPTPREWVLDAMMDYAKFCLDQQTDKVISIMRVCEEIKKINEQ